MPIHARRMIVFVLALSAGIAAALAPIRLDAFGGQQGRGNTPPPPATLGLDNGTLDFDTPDFTLKLVKDSQTIAALQPKGAKGVDASTPFDFTPADQLGQTFNINIGNINASGYAEGQAAGRGFADGFLEKVRANG